MDYKIILSPASIESLREITAWIAQDDPIVAQRIGNELLDRITLLQKFPKAGSVYLPNKKWRKLVIYALRDRLSIGTLSRDDPSFGVSSFCARTISGLILLILSKILN